MESKFDYITLTIKSKVKTLGETIAMLTEHMLLGDLFDKMVDKGRAGFYDYNYTYENINLLYTIEERFQRQGICLKMSSQGLDYFSRYLSTYGMTLKHWLGEWRALSFGDYITKCTRIDYAMDDISLEGESATITINKVFKAAQDGEIVKKARVLDFLTGADMSARLRVKNSDGQPIKGRTLYIGSRQSSSFIRFYDKKAEQLQRKLQLPDKCISWTRCEVEYHDNAAMGVLNAFLDKSEKDFSCYMCGVINNQCRFIVPKCKNISRCPLKKWWSDFLNGCTERFKLPHNEPSRSALGRAERGLKQYVRTIYTMYQQVGLDGMYRFFENQVDKLKEDNKDVINLELARNLEDDIRDYEESNAKTNYLYNSLDSSDVLRKRVEYQDNLYNQLWVLGTTRNKYRYLHTKFMEGQEVISEGI